MLVLTSVAAVGGCGVMTGWYLGLFASNGRFAELDACTLLPPSDALAPLVPHGAREPGSSRPRTLLGWGGDAWSECKWSSVPAGRDRPFRTVRIHSETKVHQGHTSAEARAERALATGRRTASQSHRTQVKPVGVGEDAYTVTDEMSLQIVVSRTVIYDVHVKFRISNALVDVSARTHARPDEKAITLVLGLAKNVAERLARTG